jgi:hypothetical protein|tara:strand:- start:1600 stop:2205 length:606 start_codon:yes stop_codon:yes gene_type:complete
MSKKNLLNEATIRRFMKLANMEPLTSPFVERLDEMGHEPAARHDDDEPMEEMYDAPADRDEDDMPAPDEMDVEMDMEVDDAPAGDAATEVEDIVGQIVQAIDSVLNANDMEDVMDADVGDDEPDLEPAPEEPAMDDMALDDEEVMEGTAEVTEEATEVTEEAEEVTEDAALDEIQVINDDELVNEVAKRVTARLVKAMAKK